MSVSLMAVSPSEACVDDVRAGAINLNTSVQRCSQKVLEEFETTGYKKPRSSWPSSWPAVVLAVDPKSKQVGLYI